METAKMRNRAPPAKVSLYLCHQPLSPSHTDPPSLQIKLGPCGLLITEGLLHAKHSSRLNIHTRPTVLTCPMKSVHTSIIDMPSTET